MIPKVGAHIRIVESERTSNWTRIDVGRLGRVIGYKVHSFTNEHGPRLLLLIRYDERAKWDGKCDLPVHVSLCQVEPSGHKEGNTQC